MLAPSVRVSFHLWFYLLGAEWRRCINVRFGGESIASVDPVLFLLKNKTLLSTS